MPYLDNFNVGGGNLKIRDLEGREIIGDISEKISGNCGNKNTPIFLDNGNFTACENLLHVDISGNSSSADIADKLSVSSGSANLPVYFKDGIPTGCLNPMDIDIKGNAKTCGTFTEVNNENLHVYELDNHFKTMCGSTSEKLFNINKTYGSLYYCDVSINLPEYFSGIMCVNVTPRGSQACYFTVTSFTNNTINGFLVCPITVNVSLKLFINIVGY